MTAKRYWIYAGDGPGVYPEEESDGMWVLWEDYQSLKYENMYLKEKLAELLRVAIHGQEYIAADWGEPSEELEVFTEVNGVLTEGEDK